MDTIIINESEVINAANTARDLAIDEIHDIRSCWGTHCADDHDRMICNLHKATDILKDVVIIKATALASITANGSSITTFTREMRPLNHPNTSVERATATIS